MQAKGIGEDTLRDNGKILVGKGENIGRQEIECLVVGNGWVDLAIVHIKTSGQWKVVKKGERAILEDLVVFESLDTPKPQDQQFKSTKILHLQMLLQNILLDF